MRPGSRPTSLDHKSPAGDAGGALPGPLGGTVPAFLATWDGVPAAYALVLGIVPGTTVLPNGAVAPIVPDPLVARSLIDGLGGLLTANLGAMIPERCGLAPFPMGATATGLALTHPGSPVLTGGPAPCGRRRLDVRPEPVRRLAARGDRAALTGAEAAQEVA